LFWRYGEDCGTISDAGRRAALWWKNLLSIQGGVGDGVGNWFNNHLRHEVGNGIRTLFWWDPWLEGGTLKNRFSRLFDLSNNKLMTVSDMFLLGWGRVERHGNG
jgi:hypothetical protein